MQHGICNLSVVPVRRESDDRSEMVTQLLFGELLEILDTNGNWRYVRLYDDKYEGWVDYKQFLQLTNEDFQKFEMYRTYYSLDVVQILENQTSNRMIPLVLGSALPNLTKNIFFLADEKYHYDGQCVDSKNIIISRKKIIEVSYLYLNSPYMWGGKTPFGIDCSGFVQMVYKLNGIKLHRDASEQVNQGEIVNFITDAYPGDLVFFDNEEGNIIHVGILIGDNKVIHASGKVRIDLIDHQGIFNVDTRKYSHRLRIIKKVVPESLQS